MIAFPGISRARAPGFLPEGEWGRGKREADTKDRPLKAVIIPGGRSNDNVRAGNHFGTT